MKDDKVVISTAHEGDQFIERCVNDLGATQQLVWHPVNKTWRDWAKSVQGFPTDQGTLLHCQNGVWMVGLIGSCYVGELAPDGTIQCSPDVRRTGRGSMILAYADPPNCGYTRDENGAIASKYVHCEDPRPHERHHTCPLCGAITEFINANNTEMCPYDAQNCCGYWSCSPRMRRPWE